ncbi:hypothetical protein GX51_02216 [Blastomyces parvus]|uniref:BTB domain-containing protein n=1 Tax=Blastomyces parvus TaxID=2060905 RepID=A0A2B7XCU4_9EURO|nr:hypothetical protein GX51_02216 [Blastomyces parvus]
MAKKKKMTNEVEATQPNGTANGGDPEPLTPPISPHSNGGSISGSPSAPHTSRDDSNMSIEEADGHKRTPHPPSPYETDIVEVYVGPIGDQRVFHVHFGILNQAPLLSSNIRPAEFSGNPDSLSLVDIDPMIVELVIRFLYTGRYQRCRYSSPIFASPEQDDANKSPDAHIEFKMHSFLYAFAQGYVIEELRSLALTNLENMTQVPYLDVLDVAKQTYPKLSDAGDDNAYREKFRHETRDAMKENKDLIREPWILDVFRNERGNLAVDLFTTLTEPLRCDGETNNNKTSPQEEAYCSSQSDRGEAEDLHSNDGHADDCIQEPTEVSVVGEHTLPAFEETIPEDIPEDIPEAASNQCPELLVPEVGPELEPAQEPVGIVQHEVDFGWGSVGGKGEKKMMKKCKEIPEPAGITEEVDDWGLWGSSKKQKGKAKRNSDLGPEPVPEPEPEATELEKPPIEADDWSRWDMNGKIVIIEPEPEPEPGPADKPSPVVDGEFGSWLNCTTPGKKKGKKGKTGKGKKMIKAAAPPPALDPDAPALNTPPPAPEPEAPNDQWQWHIPNDPAPAEHYPPDEPPAIDDDHHIPEEEPPLPLEPCSRRKLHLKSEIHWMDCARCRAELGSIAKGIVAGEG